MLLNGRGTFLCMHAFAEGYDVYINIVGWYFGTSGS